MHTTGILLLSRLAIPRAILGAWLAWRLLRDDSAALSTAEVELLR